jgi:hypothetical protein
MMSVLPKFGVNHERSVDEIVAKLRPGELEQAA